MQACFSAGSKHDKGRWSYAYLREVLDVQTRSPMSLRRRNSASLLYLAFEKVIQARSRDARAAGFIRANRQRQDFLGALAF